MEKEKCRSDFSFEKKKWNFYDGFSCKSKILSRNSTLNLYMFINVNFSKGKKKACNNILQTWLYKHKKHNHIHRKQSIGESMFLKLK